MVPGPMGQQHRAGLVSLQGTTEVIIIFRLCPGLTREAQTLAIIIVHVSLQFCYVFEMCSLLPLGFGML